MKLRNLLIIGSFAMALIATPLKAETIIETGSGVRIETNSQGGVSISTPNQKINSSNEIKIKKNDDYNDDYSINHNSSSSAGTCYQENIQSTKVEGSNRTTVQSSTLNCD